jgi:hypothetical protein
MEVKHGIKIEKESLKKEGPDYLVIKGLNNLKRISGFPLSNDLIEMNDYLFVNPDNKVFAVKGDYQAEVAVIEGSYHFLVEFFEAG